ncbi:MULTISPECIES: amino acid ABC transporter permease [Bifidobacterium]|jgi:polar amino acid transport system permease protein|uniref:Amino acid ABC transporter permease n=1 Tax=Bifidobacterium tibiigranuli TaxID=2172043 RepID=A0A5N6S409_9BIFI|nr:amino acid ABC transporter permease [Bifidobacterium tibiigranuli]KAE8128395.1 amino acid ABC transporter permease [Bifidobacterium tibiigranuli]KAE8128589.1 amino acid ABC transporter permease [Bifidobacterium tibiigranuli]MCH3974922.1 amino acid ABC transporter permease [Bifidobacterium tibiigranuli]MCH4190031.1 amino acid ABC transporter permease [Bifidobacterium tibiigranuli]MCH4202682.1 amino acid ABC transporter permease [Bifidobacterium tibiigranuli]
MSFDFSIVYQYLPYLLSGTLLTLGFSLAGVVFGSVIGVLIAFGKMSRNKWVSLPFRIYVAFFRGTPLLVQLLIINFGVVPVIIGTSNGTVAAIMSLSLNSGAYIAETVRAGVESIDRGQSEASKSLGLGKVQSLRYVIMPQAIKRILPPLGNEFISLIKDSSLASTIAAPELTYWAQAMNAQYYRVWEPYLSSAFIYLVLTYVLGYLVNKQEKRMKS